MLSTHCDALVEKLTPLLAAASGRPVLVGIDGCCASGKTTLAGMLAQRLPGCAVLHTDDYYLPVERRIPNWMRTPAANMDLARLRAEVLEPARAGRPFTTQAYSCQQRQYLPPMEWVPGALVLVEGSYSHHPSLADCYDLRIFLRCSPEEQARRLQVREGERYPRFIQRWVPLEEGYFARDRIQEQADLVLMTD